jgi:cytochrome c-type biogenesis protein CcmE
MVSPHDITPKGFFFYFKNMNFAAMSLITFIIFLVLYGIGYAIQFYYSSQKIYPQKDKNNQS